VDHTLTLTLDEENTLAELVVRSQDPVNTVDLQLASIVHGALASFVQDHVSKQTTTAIQAFGLATTEVRSAIVTLLSLGAPAVKIATDPVDGSITSITFLKQ
jgi:hypothetical protein